jgi:hypothetical protein
VDQGSWRWSNCSAGSIGGAGRFRSDQVSAADWRWVARRSGVAPDALLDRIATLAARLPDAATHAASVTGDGDADRSTRAFGRRFVDAVATHVTRCAAQLNR